MGELIFPNKIWLNIFERIDRPKLMQLRLVCHRFYDLIEELLNESPEWKKLTEKTIFNPCLLMTMQRTYPYKLVATKSDIDDPVMWRGTYLAYKKWQKVLVNPYTKDTIVPSLNFGNISCVRTFDKYIAIAFESGTIASYTIDDISQPFYLVNHGTGIIQIEFWYSNGDVLIVSLGDDQALKFWDLKKKEEIITIGFFANSISSGECRFYCIGDMEGILTSYDRVGNDISAGATLEELEENQKLIAHVMDGEQMTALAWEEAGTIQFKYHGYVYVDSLELPEFELDYETGCHPMPDNLRASFQRLIMPTVTFFFGIGENSIGSTNFYEDIWHEYNLSKHFGCHVRSIALHAQILMFGLEDGSVHLLYIPHYGYVKELEEHIKDSKKIEVDTEPIVDLTILEVDKKPCIVAVTKQKVHLINFF